MLLTLTACGGGSGTAGGSGTRAGGSTADRSTTGGPSAGGSAAGAGGSGSASAPAGPSSGYGDDARQLADEVPGCGVAPSLTPAQAVALSPALHQARAALDRAASATSCVLRGAGVVIFRFADAAAEAPAVTAARAVEPYLGQGAGWLAAATAITAPSSALSVVQGVSLALSGVIVDGS